MSVGRPLGPVVAVSCVSALIWRPPRSGPRPLTGATSPTPALPAPSARPGAGPFVGHPAAVVGPPEQLAIDLSQLHPLDGLAAGGQVLPFASKAKHVCRQLPAARTKSGPEVGRRDLERPPLPVAPAHKQVHVGVAGIVVVDRRPLERSAEVALHLHDQRPGVRGEIQARPVLGRDDELPEADVAGLLPLSEGGDEIDVAAHGIKPAALFAFPPGAVAGEVRAVRGPGGAPAIAGIGRLDDAPLKPPAVSEEDAVAAGAGPRATTTWRRRRQTHRTQSTVSRGRTTPRRDVAGTGPK